ncbi:hypothetical protein [Ruminococcus flavefaciens]|uniref:hypothetical protein n=1 Tax=Ruminococcus flavefaciens TaxID=1265 RepID=UPI0026F341B1|nr:hypothetical protein [Ruminococcus flavefaciens]
MKKIDLGILNNADDDVIEKLPPYSSDEETRKRVLAMSEKKFDELMNEKKDEKNNEYSVSVSGVEKYRKPVWHRALCTAAAVAVIAGGLGTVALLNNKSKIPPEDITASESEIENTTTEEQDITTTQTTTTEQITTTQTLTETQPPTTDNTPLTNVVRCDPTKLSDGISGIDHYQVIQRTADGFGCIAYNERNKLTYLHISEDMQTSEAFVLTLPSGQEQYYSSRRWFAIEENGIWEIFKNEGHKETEPYLLCHYAQNGELISSIPANELQDYPINSILGGDFESVGDVLYLTPYDGKVLQIDKETAKVSIVSDLYKEDDSYNEKSLFFDRDNKPVLLRKKVDVVPDCSYIHEAVVSEFDLESGSCGQTLYTTEENWELKRYSISGTDFRVLKGSGKYRLFINTSTELIGIRDDGEQELLIDIDASDLINNNTIIDCIKTPYYAEAIKGMDIIPVDDTQFLGLINVTGWLLNPDSGPFDGEYAPNSTHAFCLTRKHESEIG